MKEDYSFVYNKDNQLDINMKMISNCKYANSLNDCLSTCGRAGICQNVEVANDILRYRAGILGYLCPR